MEQSNFLKLGWRDALRGFLVAFIAFSLNWLQITFIPSLNISPEIKTFLLAGIAYLTKNYFTKPDSAKEIQPLVGSRPNDRNK